MNSQIQALAMLPKMSEQQLIQALQTGSATLPAYAVMAELQARKKRATGFGVSAPATSVKQDMMAQAGGLQSFAPQAQPQQTSVQPPMQQPMPKAPGMADGGLVYKYPYPLKDDETRLVPYDQLTRGRKQELDLARRQEAARLEALADKQRRDYLITSVLTAPGRALYGDMGRPPIDRSVEIRRQAAAMQAERFQKPSENVLYSDDIPHKLSRNGWFSSPNNGNARAGGMAEGGLGADYAAIPDLPGSEYAFGATPDNVQLGIIRKWMDANQRWQEEALAREKYAEMQQGIPRGMTEPGPPRYTTQSGIAAASSTPVTGRQQLEAGPLRSAPVPVPPAAAKTAPTGIRSVAAPAAKPFEVKPIELRSVQDAMKDIPADTSVEEQIAAIKASDSSAKDKQTAIGEALLRAGSTMMQRPGNWMSALGAGAGEGLTSLQYSNRQIQQDQNERRKELGALAIAKGRQGLERYDVANRTRFGEASIADKNQDNLFQAHKLAVESGDKALERATQVQVAGIHAAAGKAAQQDYNMQRLVQSTQAQASDDFDKMISTGLNQVTYSKMPPAELNRLRQAYIAERLKTIPGVEKYWVEPKTGAGSVGGLTDKPAGKVLTLK